MNLQTKAGRQQYQQAQIDSEIQKGATLETYKGLKIVTRDQIQEPRSFFTLLIFKDDAGHPITNEWHRTSEGRARKIEVVKGNRDARIKRQEEDKAKGTHKSNQAQAAAAIREELKTKFPGIKFSVTSEGFSMGDAVRVSWNDGPTDDQVTDITAKYQFGHFDGMTDMYEYSNRRDDIPQTKYLTTSRHQSEETKKAISEAAPTIWPGESWQEQETRNRGSREIWNNTSLPLGAIVKGFKWEGNEIVLDFEAPEATKETPKFEAQEVKAGTVQIIDYSEKAIAVIGDTRPIKDTLKNLGGKFNPGLSCGVGWIFKKSDLERVQKALSKKSETPATDLNATYKKAIEEKDEETITAIVTRKDDETVKYPALMEEVKETIQFLADSDREIYGEVTEGTKEAAKVQRVTIEEAVKKHNTLQALEEAAEAGEMISLSNLAELVNTTPDPEEIAEEPTPEEAEAIAQECNPETCPKATFNGEDFICHECPEERQPMTNRSLLLEAAKQSPNIIFCKPTAPAFFRENGRTTKAQQVAQNKTGRTNTSLDAPQMFLFR